MKLSAPIYHLKRTAKRLSREENIPLYAALNRVALQEGYATRIGVYLQLNSVQSGWQTLCSIEAW